MARIVTTAYRYKRPPKKRKAVALEMPAVVTAQRSRHPPRAKQAAAEVVSLPQSEAVQPKHIGAANDDQKPVIVTSISRKRARQRRAVYTAGKPDNGPTDDTLMKVMARMGVYFEEEVQRGDDQAALARTQERFGPAGETRLPPAVRVAPFSEGETMTAIIREDAEPLPGSGRRDHQRVGQRDAAGRGGIGHRKLQEDLRVGGDARSSLRLCGVEVSSR
jgi:hypothetical protein